MINYEKFEIDNLIDSPFFIEKLNENKSDKTYIDIISIDSKKAKTNNVIRELRASLKENFLNKIKTGEKNWLVDYSINVNSLLRGDKLLRADDGTTSTMDDKDYEKISSRFKFPSNYGLDINQYMKGIDSNVRYTLALLDINFYSDETKEIYKNLSDKMLAANKKSFEIQQPINTKLGTISKEHFTHIICSNEIGLGYEDSSINILKEKNFICADKQNKQKYMKNVNFENMVDGDVEVILFVDPVHKYVFLLFSDKDEVVYVLSQRAKLFQNNCSFILRSKTTIIENTRKPLK